MESTKLETSSLSEGWSGRQPMFSAECIAYGTALVPSKGGWRKTAAPRA